MADLLFKKVDYTVGKLLEDIELGEIALPDLQRPFVWHTTRVRDLFDSMYRGYPVGTLLFWENPFGDKYHTIGTDTKQKEPKLLIVDGQQRLTALYAVVRAQPIKDKHYRTKHIRLAFHPLTGRFEVTNTAVQRDPLWIPDISVLWQPDFDLYGFINDFLQHLEQRSEHGKDQRRSVPEAIHRLRNLASYPVTALELSQQISEEQVSEIFVRINSKGRTLNQADFILTLMSVFWEEGRTQLEDFSRRTRHPSRPSEPNPYNPFFQPTPDQLLRVDVALAFRRARLKYIYSLLRGKDLETGAFSEQLRARHLEQLREAQRKVLDLQHWADFLTVLQAAGYRHPRMISSTTAVLFCYALWLIGRTEFDVPLGTLRNLMARWFFMSSLTGRYTGSPESRMEQDLALLRGKSGAAAFERVLVQEMDAVLTPDYWSVTLPNQLATASARNTGQFAHFAALCILGAPALYSNLTVADLLQPAAHGKKKALERHHLFPRHYLRKRGVTDKRMINQVANYALVEWHDNTAIADRDPRRYGPEYERRFAPAQIEAMYHYHALEPRWYDLEYETFLERRRRGIAAVVREGFERLVRQAGSTACARAG